jgi:hypothetical protein
VSRFTLTKGLYLYPTPSGAYHAVSLKEDDKSRSFLQSVLKEKQTPELNITNLKRLMASDDEEKCMELLLDCQKLGWVQGLTERLEYPKNSLETILPDLLDKVSASGKVLLADSHGFYLACNGLDREVAEDLSALSADIATVHERRSALLMDNMGLTSHAWSLVDAAGNSNVGFWPLYIGNNRFVICIFGVPYFNRPEFVSLIWALSIRYAEEGK